MKKIIILFVIFYLNGLFAQANKDNYWGIGPSAGYPTDLNVVLKYGTDKNALRLSLGGGFSEYGSQIDFVHQLFALGKVRNGLSVFVGFSHDKKLFTDEFFGFIYRSEPPHEESYENSWYYGLAYSGKINSFFIQLGPAWGNNNFKSTRFILQIGYIFDL